MNGKSPEHGAAEGGEEPTRSWGLAGRGAWNRGWTG